MGTAALMGAQAAGGLIGTTGTIIGGLRQAEALEAQADAAKNQAKFREAVGRADAERQAKRDERVRGAIRARLGVQGVDITGGSPLKVLEENAAMADVDRRNILLQGRMESDALRYQSKTLRSSATDTLIATGFNAGSSLLGSASAMGSTYQRGQGRAQQLDSLSGSGTHYQDSFRNQQIRFYTGGR